MDNELVAERNETVKERKLPCLYKCKTVQCIRRILAKMQFQRWSSPHLTTKTGIQRETKRFFPKLNDNTTLKEDVTVGIYLKDLQDSKPGDRAWETYWEISSLLPRLQRTSSNVDLRILERKKNKLQRCKSEKQLYSGAILTDKPVEVSETVHYSCPLQTYVNQSSNLKNKLKIKEETTNIDVVTPNAFKSNIYMDMREIKKFWKDTEASLCCEKQPSQSKKNDLNLFCLHLMQDSIMVVFRPDKSVGKVNHVWFVLLQICMALLCSYFLFLLIFTDL